MHTIDKSRNKESDNSDIKLSDGDVVAARKLINQEIDTSKKNILYRSKIFIGIVALIIIIILVIILI